MGSVSNCWADFGQAPSLSEPASSFAQMCVRKWGGGEGVPRGALWVLTCKDIGLGSPHDIVLGSPHDMQPPHLDGCAQGFWGGGRKLLGAWAPALPSPAPSMGQPRASVCSVLGRSGLVCSHLLSSLQSTSLCLCNALSTGHCEKRSPGPKPPVSPPVLSSSQ